MKKENLCNFIKYYQHIEHNQRWYNVVYHPSFNVLNVTNISKCNNILDKSPMHLISYKDKKSVFNTILPSSELYHSDMKLLINRNTKDIIIDSDNENFNPGQNIISRNFRFFYKFKSEHTFECITALYLNNKFKDIDTSSIGLDDGRVLILSVDDL